MDFRKLLVQAASKTSVVRDSKLAESESAVVQAEPDQAEARGKFFRWAPGEESRTTLFPILHDDIWEVRKTIESLRWTADEIDITQDKPDWANRMVEEERHAMRYILGFSAVADNVVLVNLPDIAEEVDCLEAECAYAGIEDQEVVHMESYMRQIEAVARDEKEKDFMLNAIKNMPAVRALIAWARSWMNAGRSFYERFIAQAYFEGVTFSGFFSFIQVDLRDRNLCPGITDFNTFIMRDEGKHCEFAALLLRKYARAKPSQETFRVICESGYTVTAQMIDEAIPKPLRHINAAQLKQYVKFQTDCLAAMAGYEPFYYADNPFPTMDQASLNAVAKANFFEKLNKQYRTPKPGAAVFGLDTSPIDV